MNTVQSNDVRRAYYDKQFRDTFARYDVSDLNDAIGCSKDCMALLSCIRDKDDRELYAEMVSRKLSIAKWIIVGALNSKSSMGA